MLMWFTMCLCDCRYDYSGYGASTGKVRTYLSSVNCVRLHHRHIHDELKVMVNGWLSVWNTCLKSHRTLLTQIDNLSFLPNYRVCSFALFNLKILACHARYTLEKCRLSFKFQGAHMPTCEEALAHAWLVHFWHSMANASSKAAQR
jgi:hypothetical protein